MINNLKETFLRKLPSGSFLRNVLTLMTGTTFAQIMAIVVAPILTHLYSPGDFGVYIIYISLVGILTVIVCWRYELAIVLPEKDEDAVNLLATSVLISFSMSLLSIIIVVLFRNPIASFLGVPELVDWFWFVPLSLITTGLFQILTHWSTRRSQFKRLVIRQMIQSGSTSAIQITMGVPSIYLGACGLIIGNIFGCLIATVGLLLNTFHDERVLFKNHVNIKNIKQVFLRYIDFPLFSSWAILLNTISGALPAILLGYFFTPAIVGYYALGHRVVSAPMNFIGVSIAQVFFPKATKTHYTGELRLFTLKIFNQLVSVGLVPFLLLTIIAPELFTIVFGSNWRIAGEYVRWISLWLFIQFISSPLSTIYMILNRQKEFLVFNFMLFVTRLIALSIGGMIDNADLAIILFGFTGVVLYGILCFHILYMVNANFGDVAKIIIKQIITASLFVSLPIITLITTNSASVIAMSGIVAGIVFAGYQANKYWSNF